MRAIYSLRVFCDGNSVDKDTYELFGFYQDILTPSNPPVILWCESLLAPSTDGTTVIDGYLARSYAPIITGVREHMQSYDIDNPVVNNNDITITIANHEKCLMYIESQGVDLIGLKVRLSINIFNEAGALISSTFMFYGEIHGLNMTETGFMISCKNNKYSKESSLLSNGEILTVGELAETDRSYYKTIRGSNYKTLFDNNGQTSFLLIGGFDTINSTTRTRTYQIFFKTSLPVNLDLTGYWMYVELSTTESKGEYRRVLSSTEITSAEVDDEIAESSIGAYIGQYTPGYFLEIELEGAYTEGLKVDLCTYVQFMILDYSYQVSKNSITGTVDKLYSKVGDLVVPFGQYGYSCVLNTDGTIDLTPDYQIDEDTIATYTGSVCKNLSLIGDNSGTITNEINLREWVYELGDAMSSDPYKSLEGQYCNDNNGGFAAGFFHASSATVNIVTDDFNDNNGGAFDRRLYWPYNAQYTNTYTVSGNALVGIQFELPTISDNFVFKSVHLGIAIRSTCASGLATPNGIVCITKQSYGTAIKQFNAPLSHTGGLGSSAYINTVPGFYLVNQTLENYFYATDWQWKTPDTAPQTRFTGLESTKLQDVDTVEKYRKIQKVGLFFLRAPGTNVSDTIDIFELCVIFKHENSLTEVLV